MRQGLPQEDAVAAVHLLEHAGGQRLGRGQPGEVEGVLLGLAVAGDRDDEGERDGVLARIENDPVRAEEAFRAAHLQNPTYGIGLNQLAIALASQDDPAKKQLANQYAQTGTAPTKPQNLAQMKLSAGYATFAETFSGWRNNAADAVGLAAPATKAGVAAAYNPGSSYGIYWVLVLGN